MITASVLLPFAVVFIFWCPTYYLELVSALVLLLAAWEWTRLSGINATQLRCVAIVIIAFLALLMRFINWPIFWICFVSVVWWLIGLFAILIYPSAQHIWKNCYIGFMIGCFILIPTWLSFSWLHRSDTFGPVWVLLACCLVWSADIVAYFFGKTWGKRKLLAKISPKKTWVGVLGAFFVSMVICYLFFRIKPVNHNFALICLLSLVTVSISIVGDLLASLFKRIRGFKNSGNILPGHGGILDRIDSLLAAFPVFVLGLQILENPRIIGF